MKAPAQCCGYAASGKRCSIVAGSQAKDRCGRRAAQSLEYGGKQCLFHLELFHSSVVEDARVFYLDFETSGLDLGLDSIVEIGLLEEAGACFQTVVRPVVFREEGTAVHGISNSELAQGPDLAEAFSRMSSFVEALLDTSLDSTCTRVADVRPVALIVAHNGKSFDFPFLVSELYARGIDPSSLSRWRFADSIDLVRACRVECAKLQCLCKTINDEALQAHRALSDCLSLRKVVQAMSERYDSSPLELLKLFALELDCSAAVLLGSILRA